MRNVCVVFLVALALTVTTTSFAKPASPGIMLGAHIPTTNSYTDTIKAFDTNTDFTHTHVLFFTSFDYNFDAWPYLIDQIRAAGKIPVITWQPGCEGEPCAAFSNSSFINGDHDAQIIKTATQIKKFVEASTKPSGTEVYMRFAHEPNILSAPAWPGHSWNNQSIDEYRQMFRHVHDLFYDTLGAAAGERVVWTWSVNYMGSAQGLDTYSNWENLYPGDDYVDMTGLSGLNYGDHPTAGPGFSVTVQWLYMPILRALMAGGYAGAGKKCTLKGLARASGGKPQGIFEFGTVGAAPGKMDSTYSDIPKEDWIRQGYTAIRNMEEFLYVRLVLWYNGIATSGGYLSDFRVAQNPERDEEPVPASWTEAYKDAIRNDYFLQEPLTVEEMTPDGFYQAESYITEESYPQHEFWLSIHDGGSLQAGDPLAGSYALYPSATGSPSNPDFVDAYVAAQIPGGDFYAFIPPARWVPFNLNGALPPATINNLAVKRNSSGTAFVMTMGSTLPRGTYTFYSILVPHGEDPRQGGPDLRTSSFTLTD